MIVLKPERPDGLAYDRIDTEGVELESKFRGMSDMIMFTIEPMNKPRANSNSHEMISDRIPT